MPATSTGSYDVRGVMRAIVDDGEMFELRARWASNVVTAFATIDGRPIGILGNQPLALAGTLDIPASQKAARFVAFCDAFNLPIVTLVDTPGFYPGKDLEWRGMIRHGAQLVFAYGRATVPRICVILRKSYGGAYIVMDSKRMGNDLCLAWPGPSWRSWAPARRPPILQRRATPEERAAFEADYAERLLNPYIAAERGYVDGVIEPAETRDEISTRTDAARRQARAILGPQARQHAPLSRRRPTLAALGSPAPRSILPLGGGSPHRHPSPKGTNQCPTPSPSSTTEPGSRSRYRSPTACSRPPRCASSIRRCTCYDPAFMSTAACASVDHLPRRRRRHPALPRLPDRAAGRALDLPRGRLPPAERRAADDQAELEQWTYDVTHHTFIHENMRKRFVDGFHYDAHPMGMFVSRGRRARHVLQRRQGHRRQGRAATSRSCA